MSPGESGPGILDKWPVGDWRQRCGQVLCPVIELMTWSRSGKHRCIGATVITLIRGKTIAIANINPPIQRVAVIGAGAAGLTTLKALREEGLTPVAFEQSPEVGGVAFSTSCFL